MNTWKRAFALLLCLCITLSMVPAPAGATEGPSITANDTEVYQGNYAYVYIYANNLNDLASIDLEIFYDSEAMQLNNQWTGGLFENSVVSVNTATPGVVRLSAASFSGISGSGDLLTLVFQINSDCPSGDYPVTVAVGEAYDMALQHVHMSGTVSNIRVMERSNSGSSGTPFYLYTSADRTNLYQGETATIWLYNSSGHNLASATFTAEYDSELFELVSVNLGSNLMVEGAIYSINDRIPGLVQIIYACPTEVYAYDLMSLTLRAKENTNESSSVTFKIADAYNGSLETYGNYECNRWLYLQESQVAPDLPDLVLDTEQLIVGQQSNATLSLQADAPVAAGDFLLSYDPSVIRCVSVTASADVAANGGMIVINPFYTEGKIRFSYLNESGYDGGLELIQIVWEPVSSPDLHYCVTMSGTAVVDVHYNPVELEYVTESNCIYAVINHDPTCTEPGQLEYRCMDCLDGWYVEQDPALGHDHVASVIAPTCTEQGCDAHICSRCGDAYYENYTDALGHDFGDWYSYAASGCNYAGEERRDCSRCDAYESRELPLAEHTWCEWYVTMWPTCMSSGTEERYCTECYIYEYREMPITDHAWCEWYVTMTPTCMNSGTEARYCTWCYTYEYRELPITDHTWCEWYVTMWPTCTESGWEERYCDWCYTYESRELPALGHNYYEYVWEPSCESGGYTEHYCENCGSSYYDNYTDALGHNWGEWTLSQEPNCMETGWEERYCDRCGEYDYQELPMTDHTWCEWYVSTTPTCMNSGTEARYCTWCYTYEYRELPMTDHNYLEYVTEPGCESGGYTEYCCEYCGDSYYDNYTDAVGHNWGEWTLNQSPNCMESGWEERCCDRCGEYEYQELPVTDHTWCEWYVSTTPTCMNSGTEARYCIWCYTYEYRELPVTDHNYLEYVTEPGCESGGYTEHCCEYCGDSYYDNYTDALGHNYGDWYALTEATCTQNGQYRRDCGRCGHYEIMAMPAYGHYYETTVLEATCTMGGYTTHVCANCGHSYVDAYTEALGHAYGEWYAVTVTTCTEDGEYRRDCGRCEHYETMVMPAYGHNYESVVTEPTCTMGGYTSHTCANCGHSYVTSYTEALGHAYGEWYGIGAATCIAAGMERRDCQRCDHYEEREIPALAHSYSDAVRTEPTCTEPGTLTYTCTACGGSYTEEIPALGHDWYAADCDSPRTCARCGLTDGEVLGHTYGEWYALMEATCTEEGQDRRDCIRCDAHELKDIPAKGHSYVDVVTAPSCTVGGYTTHTCADCGDSYVDTYTEPLGHGYGEWYAVTVTTCTEDGEYRRDCGRCEHYETMVMPAYGHNYESVVTEPTCTMGGYTTHTCGNCGHSYVNSYTEALGHDYGDWYALTEATCTQNGQYRRDCGRCGHYEEREIPALAHSYSDAVRTEPTCTEPGTLTYTCTVCGGSYSEEIPALGHDWHAADCDSPRTCARCGLTDGEVLGHTYGEWYVVTAASCTESGLEQHDCIRCGHSETREISVLDHSFGRWYVATAASCTEAGVEQRDCIYCGTAETREIPALGHDWQAADCDSPRTCGRCGLTDGEILGHEYGEWFVVEEATCTEPGRELRECIRCDAHETREIAPVGHNYETVVTEATCVAGGYTTHTCTNCGHSYIDGETEINPENHVGQEGTECECGVFLGGSAVPDGWFEDKGLWYYYREGRKVTGWLQLGSIWYFMDADGVMQTGWVEDGGKWYFMDVYGAMQRGWLLNGGKWYYLNAEMKTGWQVIDSKWYYFNGAGAMQTGWLQIGGIWYYLNSAMQTGWQEIGGYTYYFDDAGAMQSGWLLDGGKWYYLNNHLQTGWQEIGGSWYYLAPAMQTGWQWIDGRWYFMDVYGAMQTGWLYQYGVWYYLGNHMYTGWQQVGGVWYYFKADGVMQTGWLQQNGIWYYLNNHMQTGWKQVDGYWYYFDGSGAMQTGWKQIGGNWYYLNNHMITGWLNLGGVWYYLDPTGAMVTGSYVIDGVTYYFDESGVWIP